MPLTPSDVSNKLFGKQVRGYSMDEVDAFLDEVEAELTRLLTENAALAARAGAGPQSPPQPVATAAPAAPQAGPEGALIASGETQEAALRTLLMAQRTADQAIAEARAEADKLLADARSQSARVDQETDARTTAALADLQVRQRELETRIEDLKAFEREYRLRLKAYLESQLKDLDTRGGGVTEGAGAGVPAAARAAAVGVTPPGVTDSAAARPAPPAAPASPPPRAPEASGEGFPEVLAPEWAELNDPDQGRPPHAGAAAPSGPPREATAPPPSLRAVPSLSVEPEPVGPFTVVPPTGRVEQVDDGPEPPA